MKYAVIGLGDFGRAIALGLARAGGEVIAVDKNLHRLDAVKDEVTLAVQLDATHREALQAQGIQEVDVLVAAIGENFEAQVLTVVHAKNFKISHVVARANTDDHRRVLEAVGASQVFYPEEEAARNIVQRLTLSNIKNYFELAEGFSLVEMKVPPQMVGKTLRELDLRNRFSINVVAVQHLKPSPDGGLSMTKFNPVPGPEEVLGEPDVIALVGSVEDLSKLLEK